MLSMTDRHLFATMLSADLQTTPSHHPTTATIYTDPPTTHHGHFLPNNPMPYMAPSATHQPELLLLNWMLCTIATLIDDLQHHPIVQDPIPPMSSFINTPAYRLFLQLRNTPAPSPSHIPPLRFYPIPTAADRQTTLQDATAQTF